MDISLLPSLLATSPPSFIHVHDPQGEIELHSQAKYLRVAQRLFVEVDCVECITQRVLYTRIINGLAAWAPAWSDGCECWAGKSTGQWDSSWDTFVHALKDIYHSKIKEDDIESPYAPVVILFKNSDRIRDLLPDLLTPITRLAELSNLPITSLFVSRCTWVDIRPGWGASPPPLLVSVPSLTQPEIITYLVSLFPDQPKAPRVNVYSPELKPLYRFFVEAVYSVCANTTTDPRQIAYIAAARWPGFVAPLLEDWKMEEANRNETRDGANSSTGDDVEYALPSEEARLRLLRFFKPSISSALNMLYPRLMHAQQWAEQNTPSETFRLSDPFGTHAALTSTSETQAQSQKDFSVASLLQGLTDRLKLMLLASYIASFNPTSTDTRMFERTADGSRKRKRKGGGARKPRPGTTAKLARSLTGPTAFSLDRFLSIFQSLLIEREGDSAGFDREMTRVQILTSMSELVQMQLLHRTSAEDKMDGSTMFKTNVDAQLVSRIAKQLRLDLADLLWDTERD